MGELNQKEVNEQMYLFVKRWLDDLPFEEIKKIPVMAIGYCLARLSKLDELLKEQEAVVRCKDCKQSGIDSTSYPHYWCSAHSEYHDADWFCADGERRTDDA